MHPRPRAPQEKPPQYPHTATDSSPLSPQLEKSPCSNEDAAKPKINKINLKVFKKLENKLEYYV